MAFSIKTFWSASRAYRTVEGPAKRDAFVTLLNIALYEGGTIGERASAILKEDGVLVHRTITAVKKIAAV